MWLWVVAGIVVLAGFVAFTGAPYVPSKRRDVAKAFDELYPLTSKDVLVDIGSGDGIVLRMASKYGAKAIGYEIHPVLVLVSRLLSRRDKNVRVRLANFWRVPLPDTVTVVYTFGDARDITAMYARVQAEATRLGREIAFMSYAFTVSDVTPAKTVGAHYLYTVMPLQ
jgi:SAM-dependent methyltransferase